MRIALAQFNDSVGDIKGNVNKMQNLSIRACEIGALTYDGYVVYGVDSLYIVPQ